MDNLISVLEQMGRTGRLSTAVDAEAIAGSEGSNKLLAAIGSRDMTLARTLLGDSHCQIGILFPAEDDDATPESPDESGDSDSEE